MKRLRLILCIALCAFIFTDAGARSVKVALILPFNVASGSPSVNYLDFYAGSLLAIENQQNAGVNVRLTVIDLADMDEDDSILDEKLFDNDVIIGPVRAGEMYLIQRICKIFGTPFVSPLDPAAEDLATDNPYFFQIPTSPKRQAVNLVARLKAEGEGPVTLFCNPVSPEEEQLEARYEMALTEAGVPFRKISYEVLRGRLITEELRAQMNPGEEILPQRVLIASEDEAFASDVVRNMNLLSSLYGIPVTLYAPNRLRAFETIDADNLYKLGLRVSTPYYVDYTNEETRNFILKYRALYNTEPSQYAFQGYDILTYFIATLNDLGSAFLDFVEYYPMDLLQNSIRFVRTNEEGGYVNVHTRDIEYRPDNTVKVVIDPSH
ncbi:MAG: amino acid ABC transporter substrate-binding protein [Bacteroidales bacterium]|nr:amino acid ABC transporter substrate-binding protein [Bacteroidales bacterium]